MGGQLCAECAQNALALPEEEGGGASGPRFVANKEFGAPGGLEWVLRCALCGGGGVWCVVCRCVVCVAVGTLSLHTGVTSAGAHGSADCNARKRACRGKGSIKPWRFGAREEAREAPAGSTIQMPARHRSLYINRILSSTSYTSRDGRQEPHANQDQDAPVRGLRTIDDHPHDEFLPARGA